MRNSLNRLEKLQLGRETLIFGRIDRAHASDGADGNATDRPDDWAGPGTEGWGTEESGTEESGTEGRDTAGRDTAGDDGEESFHIGRLAVSDAEHEPLVVDWRAP